MPSVESNIYLPDRDTVQTMHSPACTHAAMWTFKPSPGLYTTPEIVPSHLFLSQPPYTTYNHRLMIQWMDILKPVL